MASFQALEEHLEEIQIKRPSDLILEQIRNLIRTGVLSPGNRLPSERVLCDRFGVGRGHVREALRKLEFYGIVKTLPQSGTVVESIGVKALDGLISNVMGIDGGTDYRTLYEVRDVLEMQAASLAAERGTPETILAIEESFEAHRQAVANGESGLDEDAMFHIKIAEASGNILMRTLISLIAPDIIKVSEAYNTCDRGRAKEAEDEHRRIVDAISRGNPRSAAEAMTQHIIRSRQQHEKTIDSGKKFEGVSVASDR